VLESKRKGSNSSSSYLLLAGFNTNFLKKSIALRMVDLPLAFGP